MVMSSRPAAQWSWNEFQKTFSDEPSCAAYLFRCRWPEGFVCPICKGGRYAALKSRAYTYQCLDCRRQTSITAGTVMHRSKLPLNLWFLAAYLIATHPGASARRLERQLGIAYKTAWLLKQKFQRSISHGPLHVVVEVAYEKLWRHARNVSECASGSGKLIVAVAIETRSYRIRIAALPDDTTASIEGFVRSHVKPGAMLRMTLNLKLSGYGYDPMPAPFEALTPITFSLLQRFLRRRRKPIDILLNDFTVYHNYRLQEDQFETVLGVIALHGPTSYWDLIERGNPRRGLPAIRRRARRRKTVDGMREDGTRTSET